MIADSIHPITASGVSSVPLSEISGLDILKTGTGTVFGLVDPGSTSAAAYDFLGVSGLAHWYAADLGLGEASPSSISTTADDWFDLAAGYTGQVAGAPSLTTINNLRAASYDGTDDFHDVTDANLDYAQPFTVFLALHNRAHTNSDEILMGTGATDSFIRQGGSSGLIAMGANSSAGAGTVTLTAATTGIITAVFNGATSLLQVNNGTAQANNIATNGFTNGFYIGAGANTYAAVNIGEVLIYTGALSAANKTIVHDYLAAKWMSTPSGWVNPRMVFPTQGVTDTVGLQRDYRTGLKMSGGKAYACVCGSAMGNIRGR